MEGNPTPVTAASLYQRMVELAGLAERDAQREMIGRIEAGLVGTDASKVIVVEAPTGTGKSIAYLAGAFPAALAAQKTLLITTATIALQRQILDHDIPRLAQALGRPIRAVGIKGRSWRVCDRELHAAAGKDPAQDELDLGDPRPEWQASAWRRRPTPEQRDQVEAILLARGRGWNGDFEEYDGPVDPEVRAVVTLGRAACAGQACAFFLRCAHRLARQDIATAEIVVSNHDMLLTDLARGGGGTLLPAPADAIIIIDEAHGIQQTAVDRFTTTVSLSVLRKAPARWRNLSKDITAAIGTQRTTPATESARDVALQVMEETAKELDLVANELIDPLGAKELVSFRPAQWPRLVEFAVRLQQPLHTIASYLDTKRTQLRESSADVPRAVAAQLVSHIGAQYQQAVEWAAWSRHVSSAATRAEDAAPIATWAQRGTDGGVSLHAAPTDVAGHLRSWLIDRAHGLVFTSATLRTLGTFDYFASRTGLTGKAATYIALPSPFALDKQAQLIVPAVACDPREENRHNQMVAEYVSQVYARAAGTLVIFTSRRQMTAVRDLLDKQIGKRVLVSGSKPIERLLKTHRARIRKGEASILFGMDSFAEGLDLPGRECEVLVIARLPFLPPDGPVAKTRSEWLSARGRSFFAEEAVPQAYHRLVQRLGRLIRSERDTGTIHILDRRITSTQYGRRMWEALPPYTKVVETNVTGGERRSVG